MPYAQQITISLIPTQFSFFMISSNGEMSKGGVTLIFQTPPMETPDRPNDPSGVSKQLATLDNRILKGGWWFP